MEWKKVFTLIMILSICLVGQSQQVKKSNKKISVVGTVVNQNGQPVSNASIFVDGINSNRLTDTKGGFKIKVRPTVKTISVFRLMEGGQEIDYAGETELKFIIQQDFLPGTSNPESTGELVNIGYESVEKDKLTGSVGSVSKRSINEKNYLTIFDMIAGEVTGVTVSGNSVRVRGTSSINASNEPLFIVNGSPSSSISHISPRDVESIDILKGSSTAIYGVRGANGVIIIKLKGSKR